MTVSAHHAFEEVWKAENKGTVSYVRTCCTHGNCGVNHSLCITNRTTNTLENTMAH